MKGQWTNHTSDPQLELIRLLAEAGRPLSAADLYRRGAWGIRTQTIKALIRKGKITCDNNDIWNGLLRLSDSNQPPTAQP